MLIKMDEKIQEAEMEFQQQLKTVDWDGLKALLKQLEKTEDYEMCRMVQNEIDERVKHIPI